MANNAAVRLGASEPDDELLPDEGDAVDGTDNGVDQSKFDSLKVWYRQSRDFSHDWRTDARTWYDFRAGTQWSETDVAQLKDQLATQQWLSTRLSALSDQAPDVLKIPSADPLNNFSELALEGRLMVYGAYTTMFLLWGLLVSAYLFFK